MECKPTVVSANFLTSAKSIKDAPDQTVAEVVFLGRSNVGKSSTVNALTNRKSLAKSSATPGKTRLINFFDVRYKCDNSYFDARYVDLPGFGYAKVSKSIKQEWERDLLEYIQSRDAIRLFIYLRDARHPAMRIDEDVQHFIDSILKPDQKILTVYTKSDKLNQSQKAHLKKATPDALFISSIRKKGIDKLQEQIFLTLFKQSKRG